MPTPRRRYSLGTGLLLGNRNSRSSGQAIKRFSSLPLWLSLIAWPLDQSVLTHNESGERFAANQMATRASLARGFARPLVHHFAEVVAKTSKKHVQAAQVGGSFSGSGAAARARCARRAAGWGLIFRG